MTGVSDWKLTPRPLSKKIADLEHAIRHLDAKPNPTPTGEAGRIPAGTRRRGLVWPDLWIENNIDVDLGI